MVLALPLRGANVKAEGDLDFRDTLGVDKTVPVGFRAIRLSFELDSDLNGEQKAQLLKLNERYCVVHQTLRAAPVIDARLGYRFPPFPGRGVFSRMWPSRPITWEVAPTIRGSGSSTTWRSFPG